MNAGKERKARGRAQTFENAEKHRRRAEKQLMYEENAYIVKNIEH
jgi:hypothetical protein